ncbi:SET domain-containing protein 4 [Linnemannia hyalina]|uniref:SET domain-containing protein 4 n=1 Tax=Linnemannia hyalina TaxID=64524 RepID=A0A9P7Y4A2_9FUNG|nr:SET domain-containing protein 4 [Linnemannia hyalina]
MTELFIPVPTGKATAAGQMPPPKRRKPDKAPATPMRSNSGKSLSSRNNGSISAAPVYHKQCRKGRTTIIKDQEYLDFLEWLKNMGCPRTKLTLAEFSNTGRGMMATKDIKAGEVIVQVPEQNLVTMKSLQSTYGARIARFGKKVNSHMIIALHIALLVQAPERSGWLPYLRLLPKKFDTMPVRYPPDLLELLPQNAQVHVKKQKAKIEADYNITLDFLQSNADLLTRPLQYEEYEWAWLVVNTRCIYLDAKNQSAADNIALAPMLDFLNHTHDAKTEGAFCTKTKSYQIKTLLPYKKGEQVFINYGPHDNCFILVEYGFVTPNNPYNYVTVDNDFMQLSIPGESTAAKKDKLELLDMAGYHGDYVLHRNDVSFRLLAGMRLRLVNPFNKSSVATQLAIAQWHNVVNGELDQISPENERLVPIHIERLCDEILMQAKKNLGILARKKTTFMVMHLQQVWIEARDIVLSIIDKIHRKEEL